MTHLNAELEELKDNMLEMLELVRYQMMSVKGAFFEFDLDRAEEAFSTEKRINAFELRIDKDVENILALYQPVAVDLRFVLATFKINADLERIGDNIEGIAKYITGVDKMLGDAQLSELRITEMFDNMALMFEDVIQAYGQEDSKLARAIFKKDKVLNEINSDSIAIVDRMLKEDVADRQTLLYTLSMIRKLERCGDLVKNIAEEIIFYIEAKVLKHKKKKK